MLGLLAKFLRKSRTCSGTLRRFVLTKPYALSVGFSFILHVALLVVNQVDDVFVTKTAIKLDSSSALLLLRQSLKIDRKSVLCALLCIGTCLGLFLCYHEKESQKML